MTINTYLLTIESKIKIEEQAEQNRLIDTGNILMIARWEGHWRAGGKGERIQKYKLVVTEQSWKCNFQHREGSQYYSNNYVGV